MYLPEVFESQVIRNRRLQDHALRKHITDWFWEITNIDFKCILSFFSLSYLFELQNQPLLSVAWWNLNGNGVKFTCFN